MRIKMRPMGRKRSGQIIRLGKNKYNVKIQTQKGGKRKSFETNGTKEMPYQKDLDWICVSPKSAIHTIKIRDCDEVKFVRHKGQAIPKINFGRNRLLSPAFETDGLPFENVLHCIQLIEENPEWRLSLQLHKFFKLR